MGLPTSRSNGDTKNLVGERGGFLLGSRNVCARRRLSKAVGKVEIRVATGDVAQDHEEGVAGNLLRFTCEATRPSFFVRLQLHDQLVEEDP